MKTFNVDISLSIVAPDHYSRLDIAEDLFRTIRQDVDVVDLDITYVEEGQNENV